MRFIGQVLAEMQLTFDCLKSWLMMARNRWRWRPVETKKLYKRTATDWENRAKRRQRIQVI